MASIQHRALRFWASVLVLVVASCGLAECNVSFKTLKKAFTVSSQIEGPQAPENVVRAGLDSLRITYSLNASFTADAAAFTTVETKLCFAPVSQKNRKWRKKDDNLHRDKTCGFDISSRPYVPGTHVQDWTVAKNIPRATYFVRVYASNSNGTIVAFGQTTDAAVKTNLFQVRAISGRAVSIDVTAGIFSAFSLVALTTYFTLEKRAFKRSASHQQY